MAPVLTISPAQLVFKDAKPGETYRQAVVITNTLSSGVGFVLRPSNPRLRLRPEGEVELGTGKSIQVVVELQLPGSSRSSAREGFKDLIHIKSNYFDQKVQVLINPPPDGSSRSPRRALSPPSSSSLSPPRRKSPPPPSGTFRHMGAVAGGGLVVASEPLQPPVMAATAMPVVVPAPRAAEEAEGGGGRQARPAPPVSFSPPDPPGQPVPPDVQLMMEESNQRLRHSLTRDFNDKCEQYMRLFAEKDQLLREKDQLLLTKEQALEAARNESAQARARQREAEAALRREMERSKTLEEAWQSEQEERARVQAEWQEVEARWRLEQTDMSLRLRELEREVEQRRRQQDDKEGGWRHEQADMAERLRGLQSETQDLRAENKDLHSTNQRLREALSKAEADLAAAMKQQEQQQQQQQLDRRGGGLGVEEKDELLVNMLQYKLADQKEQIDVLVAELDRLKPAHAASAAQPPLYLEDGSQQQSKEQECDADALAREVASLRDMLERCEAEKEQAEAGKAQAEASLQEAVEEAEVLRERVARLEELQAQAKEVMLLREARLSESASLQRSRSQRGKTAARSSSPPRRRSSEGSGGGAAPRGDDELLPAAVTCACLAAASSCAQAQSWWLTLVQQQLRGSSSASSSSASSAQHGPPLPGAEESESTVEALRDAGVEIARLRQEILAKEIEVRQMQEDAEEQLRAARRRISSLEHSVKMVREENQVKLRELETSVRVLSGRGDVHRALACLRQELAGERVTIVYLRGEVERQKRQLGEEEAKASGLLDRLAALQQALDQHRVQQSVHQVPGVAPMALIQHFAGLMAAGCSTIEELRFRLTAQGSKSHGKRGPSPPPKRRKEGGPATIPAPQAPAAPAASRVEAPAPLAPPPAPRPQEEEVREAAVEGLDEDEDLGLSQRFSRRVEAAQLAERHAQLEEELAEVKDEALRLRLEVSGAKDASRREMAALEEAHRAVVAGMDRQLRAGQMEAGRLREELEAATNRLVVLEEELRVDRATAGGGAGGRGACESFGVEEEVKEEEQEGIAEMAGQERELKGAAEDETGPVRRRRRRQRGRDRLDNDDENGEPRSQEEEEGELRQLLDERTAQVSVLMESVEALQAAVMATREMEREEAGLMSGSWAVGKLVKRVVALTVELSHATAMKALAERRLERVAGERKRREGPRKDMAAALEEARDEARRARTRLQSLMDEHAQAVKTRDARVRECEAELQSLRGRLVESEAALACCQEHKSELEVRVRHLEHMLATAPSAILPPLPLAAAESEHAAGGPPEGSVFCEQCGALTLRRAMHDPSTPEESKRQQQQRERHRKEEEEEAEVEEPQDRTSYLTLVRQMLATMQHWHDEAMSACLPHPLGGSRPGDGEEPMTSFVDFFVDTVADVLTSADRQYVSALKRARGLEWKLRKARLELLREVRDRERGERELAVLRQCLESYREATIRRKWHELASGEQQGLDASWLQNRCRQQADTVARQEARLTWLEGERKRVQEELAELRDALADERRRAAVAEACLGQSEASQRDEARRELEELVLPRLEAAVRQWCETEMPGLICGPAKAGRAERDAMAMVEALCVSKAVNTSLQTRLEAALSDLDRTRAQVQDLSDALAAVCVSRQPERPPLGLTQDGPAVEESSSSRLRARVVELEEELFAARKGRDRCDRLLKTLATENEALRATAQQEQARRAGSEEARRRVQEEDAEELGILRREVARLKEQLQAHDPRAAVRPLSSSPKSAKAGGADRRGGAHHRGLGMPVVLRAHAGVQTLECRVKEGQGTAGMLRAELDRVTRKCAGVEAQCRVLEEEVLTKDAAIASLRESLTRATTAMAHQQQPQGTATGSLLGGGLLQGRTECVTADVVEVGRLVEELASCRLAEASALRRLRASTENEVQLRQRLEQLEALVQQLRTGQEQRPSGGRAGREEADDDDDASHVQGLAGKPAGQPMQAARVAVELSSSSSGGGGAVAAEELAASLKEQVERQASIIAYLELRLAQATASSAARDLGLPTGGVAATRATALADSAASSSGSVAGSSGTAWDDASSTLGTRLADSAAQPTADRLAGQQFTPLPDLLQPALPATAPQAGTTTSVSTAAEVEALKQQLRSREKEAKDMHAQWEGVCDMLQEEERRRKQADALVKELEATLAAESRARREAQRRAEQATKAATEAAARAQQAEEQTEGTVRRRPADADASSAATTRRSHGGGSESPPAPASPSHQAEAPTAPVQREVVGTEPAAELLLTPPEPPSSSSSLPPPPPAVPEDGAEGGQAREGGGAAEASSSIADEHAAERARMTRALMALRGQVSELYQQAQAKERRMQAEWDAERTGLEAQALKQRHELLSLRTSHSQALQSQRETYDRVIAQMEEAAELQASTHATELSKLRQEVARLEQELKAAQDRPAAATVAATAAVGEQGGGKEEEEVAADSVQGGEEARHTAEGEQPLEAGGKEGGGGGGRAAKTKKKKKRAAAGEDAASLVLSTAGDRSQQLMPIAEGEEEDDEEVDAEAWERRGRELSELRASYEAVLEELLDVQAQAQQAETRRKEEGKAAKEKLQAVTTAFRAFREKQADVVATLEHRLREAKKAAEQAKAQGRRATAAGGPGLVGGEAKKGAQLREAASFVASAENGELLEVLGERERQLAEADGKVRRVLVELRAAEAERDRAIEAALGGGAGLSEERDDAMRAALLEARLAVAEQLLDELMREVEAERDAGNECRRELAARVLQMATLRRQRAGPSTQGVLQQLAEFKRSSRTEMGRLKAIIKRLQSQVPLSKEFDELKAEVVALRSSQASAREDLARKSRLLASYKASRTADEHAITQWKAEVATMEERARAMARELHRKEAAIRDLRSRVGDHRKQAGSEDLGAGAGGGGAAVAGGYPDGRVKQVVAERDRLKQRCATLEKKIAEQAAALEEARARIKTQEEAEAKLPSLKAALQRKDGLLQAAKAKIVSYAQELSGLKAAAYQWQSEAERHLQQLQRRSMRWPPHASSSSTNSEALGESMGGVKEQLQSLARSDAQGVRSLVLSVLAMIQDDDQQQQQPQAEGRSGAAGGGGGGKAEPGEKGGGRAQGAREAGSEAGAGKGRSGRARGRSHGREGEEEEGEERLADLLGSIDEILAQPGSSQSGRRLQALVDGFMGGGGGP